MGEHQLPKATILYINDDKLPINEILKWGREQQERLELLEDIVLTQCKVAICSRCGKEWFTVGHPGGDVRGAMLLDGEPYCVACMEWLYEASTDFEEEVFDGLCQEMAWWLLRHRCHMNTSVWAKDERVLAYMKRFAP